MLIRSLRLDGFLSFAPGSEPFEMRPFNVLISPNGAGKSNVIEALDLLTATPEDNARRALMRREGLAFWLDDYILGDVWLMGALGANP